MVEVTVTDFGNEYWYAFKAKEATAIVNRAAAAALHLNGFHFCEWK